MEEGCEALEREWEDGGGEDTGKGGGGGEGEDWRRIEVCRVLGK